MIKSKMDKVYNVALIGCGQMGAAHIENIHSHKRLCLKYVCDLDGEQANYFKGKYGAELAETDAEVCISDKDVDIVIIATYPSSHLELLKLCIKHKKHILCEKPIARNKEEGEEFVRLVTENPDVKILVGYILRHNDTYKKVAEMIQNDAIGKPIIMKITHNHYAENWERFRKLIEETSPIVDCGVHYVDVMRWFTQSEIVDINAFGVRVEKDVSDGKYNYGMFNLKFADGSVGYYEVGWGNTMNTEMVKEFIGPKGRIRIIYAAERTFDREAGNLIEYFKFPEKEYELTNVPYVVKPTDIQLEYLIKMIEENVPARPAIEDVKISFDTVLVADEIIRKKL